MTAASHAQSVAIGGFMATLGLWAAVSATVVANRLFHERRQRRLIDIARTLTDPSVAHLPPLDRAPAIRRILARRSRREVYRLVASPDFPDWLTELCAVYSLEYVGLEQMRRDASPGRTRTRWRRISALIALGHIRAVDADQLLGDAVCDEDPEVAAAAARALFGLGNREGAAMLVSALRRSSVPASRIATYLDRFPIPIDDLLLPLLKDPAPRTRYWAASLLERYPGAPGIVPDLAALLKDADASVRKAALSSLTASESPVAIEFALAGLGDPVGYVRSTAVRAIGNHASGESDDSRRLALASAIAPRLSDLEWEVRLAAKEALVRMGHPVWRAVAAHLESPDRFGRNGAAEVLQNMGVLDDALRVLADGVVMSAELRKMLARAFQEGGRAMIDAMTERTGFDSLGRIATALPGVRSVGGSA